MDLERDQMIEIGVSAAAVALMIAVMAAVGTSFSGGDTLSPQGGTYLVGSIVFFIFLMGAVGYALAVTVTGDDDEADEDGEADY